MALVLLAFGAVGHVVLWVALVNRVHALGIAAAVGRPVDAAVRRRAGDRADRGCWPRLANQIGPQAAATRLAATAAWTYIALVRRRLRRRDHSSAGIGRDIRSGTPRCWRITRRTFVRPKRSSR